MSFSISDLVQWRRVLLSSFSKSFVIFNFHEKIMVKVKLPMELIKDERLRATTFVKKKTGLKKKLYECTRLCGVDACMIVYGPYTDDKKPVEFDVWPENRNEVKRILDSYKSSEVYHDVASRRIQDLSDFNEVGKDKKNDASTSITGGVKAKDVCPALLDSRIQHASLDQLNDLIKLVDSKIYEIEGNDLMKELLGEYTQNPVTLVIKSDDDVPSVPPQSYYSDNVPTESYPATMPQLRWTNEIQQPQQVDTHTCDYSMDQNLASGDDTNLVFGYDQMVPPVAMMQTGEDRQINNLWDLSRIYELLFGPGSDEMCCN